MSKHTVVPIKEMDYGAIAEYNRRVLECAGQKPLTAADFPYATVQVMHNDGSFMSFKYAFMKEVGDYLYIFTEHNGYHVWPKEDLAWYTDGRREIWVPRE